MTNLQSALAFYRATPEQIREKALRRREACILDGADFRLNAAYVSLPPIPFIIRRAA